MTLITSIGNKIDLILQYLDFFNRDDLEYSDDAYNIKKIFQGHLIDKIIIIHTIEQNIIKTIDELFYAIQEYKNKIEIEKISLEIDDVKTTSEDIKAREIIFNIFDSLEDYSNTIISSAGRKNITNHMIEAGLLYGCKGYLTITAPFGKESRENTKEFSVIWTPISEFISNRRIYFSKLKSDAYSEKYLHDNFSSINLFPKKAIEKIYNTKIGIYPNKISEDLEFLRKLPKADLHCHLGGQVKPKLLKKIADSIIRQEKINSNDVILYIEHILNQSVNTLNSDSFIHWIKSNHNYDTTNHLLSYINNLYKQVNDKFNYLKSYQINACFLSALREEQIEDLMWGNLNEFNGIGLKKYMQIGDLGGSLLLQTKDALELTLSDLINDAISENIIYLEVRCSPVNYTKGNLSENDVMEILINKANEYIQNNKNCFIKFIISGTRHRDYDKLKRHVDLAVKYSKLNSDVNFNLSKANITGFDLAGEESGFDIKKLREILNPIYDNFIQVTIHAGEMEESEKIWHAIYTFHALRIGHGLKLINNKDMMHYIRDAALFIEMCPSSNIQTNKFIDFSNNLSINEKVYPLKYYMENDIIVTINTDNRGISKTTLSDEYIKASNLTQNGISLIEILHLIRNGFKGAFIPLNEKKWLLNKVDKIVMDLLVERYFD